MSEKNAILICLIAQGGIYLIKRQFSDSLGMIFFCRVLQGLFDVLNSVGKSFTFEFCDVDYIQICFTIKGFVALVMGNIIPPIGVDIYHKYCEKDYALCCWYMAIFSFAMAAVFYVAFYLLPYSDNTQDAIDKRKKLLEKEKMTEEEVKKADAAPKALEKKHGFFCVLKFVLSKRSTRNLFIVYMISKSLHKSMYTFKNIYFLKDIELGGLGFQASQLKTWHYYAIVPAFIILFGQPKLVPSKISYQNFIALCIGLFTSFLILIPIFTDIYQATKIEFIKSLMLFIFLCISLFTAKLYTPAMNILLNLYLEKSKRPALNSIFYFGSSFLTIFINELTPMISNYFFDDLIQPLSEANKYLMMIPFVGFQVVCLVAILTAGIDQKESTKN